MLAALCIGFSVFTALTLLGALALGLMWALRFSVVLFEAVSFPSHTVLASRWFPCHEYGRVLTISLSGVPLGQTL